MSIILDMIFWARFIYIKTQFYKTEGIAYGNDNHYFSEFLIRDDKGYNYVGWVSRNIFSPLHTCLLYTSPSPRDKRQSRMPSSA